jgi:hypothetical protein
LKHAVANLDELAHPDAEKVRSLLAGLHP